MSRNPAPPPPPPPPTPPEVDEYNPLFEVASDTGPFLDLGTQFSINKARWNGKAFATPTAIYLLKKARNNQTHGGGLVGAMLSAALAADDKISTCTAADLPAAVREKIDRKGKLAKKSVVIVPESTVSLVKTSPISNAITFISGADTFIVYTSLFKFRSTPKNLIELGWALNTQLTPRAAAIHDTRTEEERAIPAGKPIWIRALLIFGAIAIFLAVIILRVIADNHH